MKTLSYFSYKGGSGRTSLLYNTLPLLAKEMGATPGSPIVVADFDLDSKGLTYLLEENTDEVSQGKLDAVDVLSMVQNASSKEVFFNKLNPVGRHFGFEDGSILFVSAPKGKFIGKDNSNFDSSSNDYLNSFVDKCEDYGCKAVIFDTPAGDQTPGRKALKSSDIIILVMRITMQFRKGTYEFLKTKIAKKQNTKMILAVPNAVPDDNGTKHNNREVLGNITSNSLVALGRTIASLEEKEKIIKERILEAGENTFNNTMILNGGINEVREFKFVETNLYNKKREYEKGESKEALAEDEAMAYGKYEILAKEINEIKF